jgi:tetratricopeptide (TPR) repeat protein
LYKICKYNDGEGIAYERNAKMRIASYYKDVLGSNDTALLVYDTINQLFEKQSLANVYEVHLEQGKIYWELKNFSKAYQCWMPCLKWYNHPQFLDYFERLATLHPTQEDIVLIANYIRYNMAVQGSKKEVFNKVIKSSNDLEVDKKYSSLKEFLIAECYFHLTDFQNAIKFYDKALKTEKDTKQKINLMYRKSQCYWTLKDVKSYRNQIREVEKFKRDNL